MMKIYGFAGMTAHVMTFEVGAVLEDPKWQSPVYCFNEFEKKENAVFKSVVSHGLSRAGLKTGLFNVSMLY